MSMPHAPPPTSPSIHPIGHLLAAEKIASNHIKGFIGLGILAPIFFSFFHDLNAIDAVPLPLQVYVCLLIILLLRLVNKSRELKFVMDTSLHRNYLGRLTYRLSISMSLCLVILFIFSQHLPGIITMLLGAGLFGLSTWNLKAPNRRAPYNGTNSINNYWKRITGKAAFSQLDYGPGDTVRFSYEDAQTRSSGKQYNVYLNRILESRFDLANDGHITWEREALWSAYQRVSPDQLSHGLTFGITVDSKKVLTPSFYRLLYWEVILQEVDGSFLERFLVGVDRFGKVKTEQLDFLR